MYLGIDIGGTKTLIALFNTRGRVIKKVKFKTAARLDEFLSELVHNLETFRGHTVMAVTIAVPGVVQKNCSAVLGNRDWGEVDFRATLSDMFQCPVFIENDANLAALYEGRRLRGKVVFLTFSTGIGGGIVENGRILAESDEFEPGHVKYLFNGKQTEWEDIAAASALEKAFGEPRATDLRGTEVMKEIAARIAMGLPDIVKTYHPATIILGGPLGKIYRLYVKYLPRFRNVKYRRPERPTESVIYGCYVHSKNQLRLS